MLPLILLRIQDLCRTQADLFGAGKKRARGRVCAFHADPMRQHARDAGLNLDRYLTRQILEGLLASPVRSPVLFWYESGEPYLFLSATSPRRDAPCSWMAALPTFFEGDSDSLRDNSRPFLLWDGEKLLRLYRVPPDIDPEDEFTSALRLADAEVQGIPPVPPEFLHFVSDFGAFGGWLVVTASPACYDQVLDNQVDNWDYSVIPETSRELVGARQNPVFHVYWKPSAAPTRCPISMPAGDSRESDGPARS